MDSLGEIYECFICCEECEKNDIVLCNNKCDVQMCENCFELMVDISNREFVLPKCPNIKCNAEYYLSSINGYDAKLIESYLNSLHKNLMAKHNSDISYIDMKEKLINEYHRSRIEYIDNFPAAIKKIISIAYPKKMKSLKETIKININNKINDLKKPCFNPLCVGRLDDEYKCVLCSRIYCKDCEHQVYDDHQCDENILKDKEYIKTIPKCPKCFLPILKSYGCDNMTCSHCRTNFSYERGVFTDAGNHNVDIKIKLNKERTTIFSILEKYYDDANIKKLLINIDDKYVKPIDDKNLIKFLMEEPIYDNLINIANEYEKLAINKKMYNNYQLLIDELYKLHKNNKLNVKCLEHILDKLE